MKKALLLIIQTLLAILSVIAIITPMYWCSKHLLALDFESLIINLCTTLPLGWFASMVMLKNAVKLEFKIKDK